MRYEIGIALLAAAIFGVRLAWRYSPLGRPPKRRRRLSLSRGRLAKLVAADAARVPRGTIRRRPF